MMSKVLAVVVMIRSLIFMTNQRDKHLEENPVKIQGGIHKKSKFSDQSIRLNKDPSVLTGALCLQESQTLINIIINTCKSNVECCVEVFCAELV